MKSVCSFLAHPVCYSALYASARPSVCLSVRPSVTRRISQKRLKLGSWIFAEFPWAGASNDSGVDDDGIFWRFGWLLL